MPKIDEIPTTFIDCLIDWSEVFATPQVLSDPSQEPDNGRHLQFFDSVNAAAYFGLRSKVRCMKT